MWLHKVYKPLYTQDTVPCRAHVHMFTIIQFLRARANIDTVLRAKILYPWATNRY